MVKLPIIVLSFGSYSSGKIYATENEQGATILPIFTDADVAQAYISKHSEYIKLATLPISAAKVDYKLPSPGLEPLACSALGTIQAVEDVLRLACVSYGRLYVAIDPPESSHGSVICYDVEEFIELLVGS